MAAPDNGPIFWERIPCPLCDAREEELLLAAPGEGSQFYRLVRCRSCGLGYLNPRPVPECIGRFYQDEYECYQPPTSPGRGPWQRLRAYLQRLVLSRSYGYPPALERPHEKALAFLLGPLVRWGWDSQTLQPYRGRGEMLDVGCGSGWFAHRMRQQGWKVTGLDFSPFAAGQAARTYDLPVLVGGLPHPDVGPDSFDLITMGCVLEHVHQPHEFIGAAARALRPGGGLLITVPNLAAWGFRFFGPDWWPLELPRHLLHFTPATLRRLIAEHGLEVEEMSMVARPSWMRRSFALAKRRGGLRARLGKLRVVPSLLTRWTVWKGRADCLRLLARRPAVASPTVSRPTGVPATVQYQRVTVPLTSDPPAAVAATQWTGSPPGEHYPSPGPTAGG